MKIGYVTRVTSIVGIQCKDGIVIGADSSATFGGSGGRLRTIEQLTERKIEIIQDQVIVAGTGAVGHGQRFIGVVKELFTNNQLANASALNIAKLLSAQGIREFAETHIFELDYGALVAYVASGKPILCELPGGPLLNQSMPTAFQPELKEPNDLWFVSMGSGQSITDSFLALFRQVFWPDEPPNLQGGIFMALWALSHACEVNPGGINRPERIAVLAKDGDEFRAKLLDDDELAEHRNLVNDATKHMRGFRDVVEGQAGTSDVPMPGRLST